MRSINILLYNYLLAGEGLKIYFLCNMNYPVFGLQRFPGIINPWWWILALWQLTLADCTAQETQNGTAATEDARSFSALDSLLQERWWSKQDSATFSDHVLSIAQSFKGVPYKGGTLEVNDTEALVINFKALDCWTFVENTLAIAAAGKDSTRNAALFEQYLQQFRYRDGHIDGYESRIHYFLEWVLNAQNKGWLRDMTQDLGGIPYRKKVRFMTDNPHLYPKIKEAGVREKVLVAQTLISDAAWYYIPKKNIAAMESKIHPGDIIVLTSSRPNLDVEHEGFAVRGPDGRIYLLHASSVNGKVVQSKASLVAYISKVPAMSGRMVLRVK